MTTLELVWVLAFAVFGPGMAGLGIYLGWRSKRPPRQSATILRFYREADAAPVDECTCDGLYSSDVGRCRKHLKS